MGSTSGAWFATWFVGGYKWVAPTAHVLRSFVGAYKWAALCLTFILQNINYVCFTTSCIECPIGATHL
ncbi:hypothetical protein DHW03_06830 [Pedobacter yonginense]|uniref:Uncharacterized protein n=1 Tax=Pedobacter yonginense TaxID=651869 RepID=A0A317EWC5_9SPHI|nr:hypothetical protein DHW03_06830 [Pedobacter yonginense]